MPLLKNFFTKQFLYSTLTGGSGALIGLLITTLLTELVFGREKYFTAYLIGVSVGIIYAFIIFSQKVFRGSGKRIDRKKQFILFILHMTILVVVQTVTVNYLTSLLGVNWYLPIIFVILLVLSVINFFIYKYVIFVDTEKPQIT